MLTVKESAGLKEVLNYINDEDIFSILETVTKRMLVTRSRKDAIEKILSSTEKPSDLLRRQKVTKKVLFNYLIKSGVSISADSGKSTFVKLCLQKWSSSDVCKESDYDEMEMEDTKPNNCTIIFEMGLQFSNWFFEVLNNMKDFGPEHFWPDCYLWAEMKHNSNHDESSLRGANEVADFLAKLIIFQKLYFHANNDSIKSQEESHGLVKIDISGVVHQHLNCIGLFDSSFGLVQNPAYEDTWKIKFIQMKLHMGSDVQQMLPVNNIPRICQIAG